MPLLWIKSRSWTQFASTKAQVLNAHLPTFPKYYRLTPCLAEMKVKQIQSTRTAYSRGRHGRWAFFPRFSLKASGILPFRAWKTNLLFIFSAENRTVTTAGYNMMFLMAKELLYGSKQRKVQFVVLCNRILGLTLIPLLAIWKFFDSHVDSWCTYQCFTLNSKATQSAPTS